MEFLHILWLATLWALGLLLARELIFGSRISTANRADACSSCSYSLSGLSDTGTCPECGKQYSSREGSKAIWQYGFTRSQVAMLLTAMCLGVIDTLLGSIPELIVASFAYLGPGREIGTGNWMPVMVLEASEHHRSSWAFLGVCMAFWLPLARASTKRQCVWMVIGPILGEILGTILGTFSQKSWNQGVYVGFRDGSFGFHWIGFAIAWLGLWAVNGAMWLRKLRQTVYGIG